MHPLQKRFNQADPYSLRRPFFRSPCWRVASELGALGFVFYLWMLSQSALAADPIESKRYSSLWLTPVSAQENDSDEQLTDFSALQLETDVTMKVTGPIARVLVKQVFYNPSQLWAEGEYRYPLPETAAVDHLRMHIGEREVEGQIQEKQHAARTFAKARNEGKRASLLSHKRSNQFRTQVTNIGPQERITLEFEYQQFLDYKDGRYDLRFPMVSSPAYTPSRDFVLPDHLLDRLSAHLSDNHFRSLDELPGNPVRISVDIDAGIPIQSPESASHPVSVKALDETRYRAELAGRAELSNRDFLLSWRPKATSQPRVTVLQEKYPTEYPTKYQAEQQEEYQAEHQEKHQAEQYGMLMIMPPQEEFLMDGAVARELVFVLDVSGSMQGASITQAKAALLQALGQLKEGDFFNLVWFNNLASSLFPESQQATARNLALARHKVQRLSAKGGTNMLPALRAALETTDNDTASQETPVLRQVVFITDGAVSNEAELFSMIRQQLGDSRLFTVGIGSAPNSYFMRKAAAAGRGSFTYVNQTGQLETKISALFKRLEAPALTDVSIDFQGYDLALFPNPLPDVYFGEPLYAVFKSAQFPEYATVSGKINGREVYIPLSLKAHANEVRDRPSLGSEQRGIAGEWARRKIDYLLEQHRESGEEGKAETREAIVSLALSHHLVSKFTSLVAVDVRPARAGGALNQQNLAANLPHGWALGSGKSQTIHLAQTATGLWFQIYSGLLALCLAGVLFYFLACRPTRTRAGAC
jgi:Ca-activated chloride channel homolog